MMGGMGEETHGEEKRQRYAEHRINQNVVSKLEGTTQCHETQLSRSWGTGCQLAARVHFNTEDGGGTLLQNFSFYQPIQTAI